MTLPLIVCALGTLLIVLLIARVREQRAAQWRALLEPNRHLAEAELQASVVRFITEDTWREVEVARGQNDRQRALRMLDSAVSAIEQGTPYRLARLKAMAQRARMIAAVMVPPPIDWRAFRLCQLSTAAGVVAASEMFLVGTAERFAWRMTFLAYGFKTALRIVLHSRTRLGASDEAWPLCHDAMRDYGTLDDVTLEHQRALAARRIEA